LRSLSIFTLLVASASFASATVVNFNCQLDAPAITLGVLNGGGATSVTCGAFTAPALNEITNFTLRFNGSFQDGDDQTNKTVGYAVTTSNAFGSIPNVNFMGTDVGVYTSNTFVNQVGLQLASIAQFQVNVTTTTGNLIPNSASYSVRGTYTYEVISDNTIPEPSTLALVGGVLVLAGIRKFRS